MKALISLLSLAASVAYAQPAATDFPADASMFTPDSLKETLSGKLYAVKLADGTGWRMDFKSNGYWFFNTSKGFADKGKWTVQDSKLCTEGEKIKLSCNEVRKQGDVMLLKRDSGDIIQMVVQ